MALASQWDDTSDVSTTPAISSTSRDNRTIDRIEKFSRLPVWPVWNGVFLFIVSRIFGEETAAKLEDAIGGRVCPNFFQPERTSPFIMLVHHRHSFAPWDPLRYLQRTFFPEGFPAHPHRGRFSPTPIMNHPRMSLRLSLTCAPFSTFAGFVTVTYILKGGFSHRDSLGIKQIYGAEARHAGKHTQWLTTGAGILHEEMFDIAPDDTGVFDFLQPSSQELYQLWLNVPSNQKMMPPRVDLLGGEEETPTVVTENGDSKTETLVLAGTYGGKTSKAPLLSDIALLHVKMSPGSTWIYDIPDAFRTAIMYVRTGSLSIGGERVPPQHTAYLGSFGTNLEVTSKEGADFLLMAGEPLNEPVAAQGSMVMNSPEEINMAYNDYQSRRMGSPWDHKMSDEEWSQHVRQYPSTYTKES